MDTTKEDSTGKPRATNGQTMKTYHQPRLLVYGTVKGITASGTSGGSENSQMQGSSFMASDRRIKERIVRIGNHPTVAGIGIYLFEYKSGYRDACGHGRQFGVMADEVEAVLPKAVMAHPSGYNMVDYAMLGMNQAAH